MIKYDDLEVLLINGNIRFNEEQMFDCSVDLECKNCPLKILTGLDTKYLCEHEHIDDKDYEHMLVFIDKLKETNPEVFL